MTLTENDLLGVVTKLRNEGYTDTLHFEGGKIYSTEMNNYVAEKNIKVEKGYRFDITENAVDTQLLFIVSHSDKEKKGLIIDLLGTHYYSNEPISKILQVPMETYVSDDESEFKYGLKKIYKEVFNKNPERFELRIDYPDFPSCPFGFGYKALGWDNEKQKYVWLVTSIIKDEKLKVKRF